MHLWCGTRSLAFDARDRDDAWGATTTVHFATAGSPDGACACFLSRQKCLMLYIASEVFFM